MTRLDVQLGAIPTRPSLLAHAPPLRRVANASPPPAVLDRRNVVYQPGLFRNDVLPVCTAAGVANAALAVAALEQTTLAISEEEVLRLFAACVDCAPTDAAIASAGGAVILDMLLWQVQHGFDIGDQTPLVGLSGKLPLTRTALANCAHMFGSVYLGVHLYDRDMQDFDGRILDNQGDPGAFVGDHLLLIWDYLGLGDDDTLRVATWGSLPRVTWSWVRDRAFEAHGLFWRQLSPARMAPDEADRLAVSLVGRPPLS